MNDVDLWREVLERKRAELEARLRRLDEIAIERAPDAMDEMRLISERELAIASLDRETTLLGEVREALRRIFEGSYGTCLRCGGEISHARLAAVPWAAYCIRCQEALDREQDEPARPEAREAA